MDQFRFTLIMGMIVLSLCLSGCQSQNDAVASNGQMENQQSADVSENETGWNQEVYQNALEGITNYEAGTAGSSLKIYIAAANLLNVTEQYDDAMQKTLLYEATVDYLAALDQEQLQYFKDHFAAIDQIAREIIANDQPQTKSMLEDAGSPQAYDIYDADQYEAVKTIIVEVLDDLEGAAD